MGNIKSKPSSPHELKNDEGTDPYVAMAARIMEIMADEKTEMSSTVLIPWLLGILSDKETSQEAATHESGPIGVEQLSHNRPFCDIIPPLTHVSSVQEVIDAVNTARQQKTMLRTTGAEHSVLNSIFPEVQGGITLRLFGQLREVHFMSEAVEEGEKVAYFKVGAGCYLGVNPMDRTSTLENSACYQINAKGYAFPILGGISQQTVGGFMMTSSAGGSLKHGFADVIQDIEFVDGKGDVQVAKRGTDMWSAVGVSMGLFGIITNVSFRLPQTFLVEGTEECFEFVDSDLGPGEDGKSRIEACLKDNEYFHADWFPQKGVARVMEWKGTKTETGTIEPYHHTLQSLLASSAAAAVLTVTNAIQQLPAPTDIDYKIMACLLKMFVPLDKPKRFLDLWYKALPIDNQAPVNTIIKVDFTEIWIPIEKSQQVITTLQNMFQANPKTAGSFAVECYGAKTSPFWMSMSHAGDVIRIDVYWWHYNQGDIREYYSSYWEALLSIEGARMHWGKWLPLPGQKCGSIVFNEEWMKKSYPKYEAWMKLRDECDPDKVFVTPYWRGIPSIPPV